MQGPELYLNQLGISLPCMLSPERDAILDSAHRTLLGYETYFFADQDSKMRFDASPERFCGVLTDPVSLRHFHPSEDSPRLTHDGRLYVFSTDSTRGAFAMMPGAYAYPEHKMLPKDSTESSL